jgi:Undecaprenyl-phosphate galactose phosphotransferase WbaP
MSTVMMAPERPPLPSQQSELEEQQPTGHLWSPQVACALLLVLTDVSAIALSLEIAILLRNHLLPSLDRHLSPQSFPPFWQYARVSGWMWLVLVLFLAVEGLYTQRRSLWNEIGHLAKAIGLGVAAILAAAALAQLSPGVSRAIILLTAMNLLVLLPPVRYWAKWILGRLGLWRKRILIMGAANTARLAMQGLTSDPVLGYEVAGLLDDDPLKRGKCIGMCGGKHAFVLGSLAETREQMVRTKARDVLIAMPGLSEEKLMALVHRLQSYCESIYVVPQLWGLPMMNLQIDGFLRQRVMMFKLSNNLAKPWNSWLKRSLDLLLGAVLTILAVPLGLAVGVLIKMDSAGPALFVQERLGYRGRNFRCIKFRTMLLKGDDKLAQYLRDNPNAADEWRRYAKLREYDPRLTRVGRFLRRWSLDELPQLLNVLKGEMSLIGPRPYLPQERSRIGVNLSTILSARPGVTGFWQVNGRNHVTIDERVQLEAWYVRNWTVWLDCIVLAKTFKALAFPQNGTGASNARGFGATASNRASHSCDLTDF